MFLFGSLIFDLSSSLGISLSKLHGEARMIYQIARALVATTLVVLDFALPPYLCRNISRLTLDKPRQRVLTAVKEIDLILDLVFCCLDGIRRKSRRRLCGRHCCKGIDSILSADVDFLQRTSSRVAWTAVASLRAAYDTVQIVHRSNGASKLYYMGPCCCYDNDYATRCIQIAELAGEWGAFIDT